MAMHIEDAISEGCHVGCRNFMKRCRWAGMLAELWLEGLKTASTGSYSATGVTRIAEKSVEKMVMVFYFFKYYR